MKRESNFEVLRTIAMFFIVVYHCLTHGVGNEYGFNIASKTTLSNVLFSDFMLVFSSIAVNLYVMISGYFLSESCRRDDLGKGRGAGSSVCMRGHFVCDKGQHVPCRIRVGRAMLQECQDLCERRTEPA